MYLIEKDTLFIPSTVENLYITVFCSLDNFFKWIKTRFIAIICNSKLECWHVRIIALLNINFKWPDTEIRNIALSTTDEKFSYSLLTAVSVLPSIFNSVLNFFYWLDHIYLFFTYIFFAWWNTANYPNSIRCALESLQ